MTPILLCFIIGWCLGDIMRDWVRYHLSIKESEARRLMVYLTPWEYAWRRAQVFWWTLRFQWKWPFFRRVPMHYSAEIKVGWDLPFPEYGHFIVFKRTEKPPL